MKKLLCILVTICFIGSCMAIIPARCGWDDRWSNIELMASPNNYIRIPKRVSEIQNQAGYGILYVEEDSQGMRLMFQNDTGARVDLSGHAIPPGSVLLNNVGNPDASTVFEIGEHRVTWGFDGADGPHFRIIQQDGESITGNSRLFQVREGSAAPTISATLGHFIATSEGTDGLFIDNMYADVPFEVENVLLGLRYYPENYPGPEATYIKCKRGVINDFIFRADGSANLRGPINIGPGGISGTYATGESDLYVYDILEVRGNTYIEKNAHIDRKIVMPEFAATGTPQPDLGWLYVNDKDGVSTLFFEGDDGVVHDLISHDTGTVLLNNIGDPDADSQFDLGVTDLVFYKHDIAYDNMFDVHTGGDLNYHTVLTVAQSGGDNCVGGTVATFSASDKDVNVVGIANISTDITKGDCTLLTLAYTGTPSPHPTDAYITCADPSGPVFVVMGTGGVYIKDRIQLEELPSSPSGPPSSNNGWLYTRDDESVSTLFYKGDDGVEHNLVSHDEGSVLLNNIGDPDGSTSIDMEANGLLFHMTEDTLSSFNFTASADFESYLFRIAQIGDTAVSGSPRCMRLDIEDPDVNGFEIVHTNTGTSPPGHFLLHLNCEDDTPNTAYIKCEDIHGVDFTIMGGGNAELAGHLQIGPGTPEFTLDAGDLYVTTELEVDGDVYFDNLVVMKESAPAGTPISNYGWLYVKDNGGTSNLYFKDDGDTVHDLTAASTMLWNNIGNPTANKTIDFGFYTTTLTSAAIPSDPRFSFEATGNLNLGEIIGVTQIGSDASPGGGWLITAKADDEHVSGIRVYHNASTGFVADHSLLDLRYQATTFATNSNYIRCTTVGDIVDFVVGAGGHTTISGHLKVGPGTPEFTLDAGDLYVTDKLEVDGGAHLDGGLQVGDGIPTLTVGEDDAFITGHLEVEGALRLDDMFMVGIQPTVPSATILDLGSPTTPRRMVYTVTGSTDIAQIHADSSMHGRIVILKFTGSLTVGDGFLQLAGNFAVNPGDILMLVCDDYGWWYEISRSVNSS